MYTSLIDRSVVVVIQHRIQLLLRFHGEEVAV